MSDEHLEATSGNGRSPQSESSSTATAELVDRRWFEDALRAQGFLVEAPADLDEAPVEPVATPAEPEPAAFEWLGPDPATGHQAVEVAPTVSATALARAPGRPTCESPPAAAAPEPDTQPSDNAAPPSTAVPSAPTTTWPVIGDMPTRVAAAPRVAAATAPVASGPSARRTHDTRVTGPACADRSLGGAPVPRQHHDAEQGCRTR